MTKRHKICHNHTCTLVRNYTTKLKFGHGFVTYWYFEFMLDFQENFQPLVTTCSDVTLVRECTIQHLLIT